MEQIKFVGHVFTKDGLKPSPDKVRAVKECGVPENKEVTRKEVTRKETKFYWGKQGEATLGKILDNISTEKTMEFFDSSKPRLFTVPYFSVRS